MASFLKSDAFLSGWSHSKNNIFEVRFFLPNRTESNFDRSDLYCIELKKSNWEKKIDFEAFEHKILYWFD